MEKRRAGKNERPTTARVERYQENRSNSGIKKANNWKSPGADKVPNFLIKHPEVLHEGIAREYILSKHHRRIPVAYTRPYISNS